MKWVYRNKKTGETVESPCVDSYYWTPDWECIETDYKPSEPEASILSNLQKIKESLDRIEKKLCPN
jgi:hypothetical protein